MITTLIILGILTVFIIGFVQVYNRHSRVVKKIDFAGEYRNKFVEFANKYFQTYDRYNRSGEGCAPRGCDASDAAPWCRSFPVRRATRL